MPDLDQERIPPQKTIRSRTRLRLERLLAAIPTGEIEALTPRSGDSEDRAVDKYHGAISAALDQLNQAQSWVSVLKHGADPTGVADSAAAFDAAILEASRYSEFSDEGTARQGGTVFIPAGVYRISRTIVVDRAVSLRGEGGVLPNGPNVGILWGSKLVSYISDGSDVLQVRGYGLSGEIRSVGLYDFSIQGSGQDRDGVNYEAAGPGGFRAVRLTVRGCGRTGLRFETNTGSLAYTVLDGLSCTSNGEDGFYLTQAYGGGNAVGFRATNCYAASNARSGYRVDGLSQAFFDNCVENDSGGAAWYVRGIANCFLHCFAEDSGGAGFELYQARDNEFIQLNVARCSAESTDGLLKLGTASYGNRFSGCRLDLPSASAAPHINFAAADASWNSCSRFTFAETPVVTDAGTDNLREDFFDASLAPSAQDRSTSITGAADRTILHGVVFPAGSYLTLENNNYLRFKTASGSASAVLGVTASDIINLGTGALRINLLPGSGGLYLGAPGTTASVYIPRTADATSGATTKNSNNFNFDASYWDGSQATTVTASIRHSMDAVTPASSFYFRLNGVDVARILSDGSAVFGPTSMAADANSVVTLNSTSRGLMLPRLTTAQRDAMSSPADGIILFNTTLAKVQARVGGVWVDLH